MVWGITFYRFSYPQASLTGSVNGPAPHVTMQLRIGWFRLPKRNRGRLAVQLPGVVLAQIAPHPSQRLPLEKLRCPNTSRALAGGRGGVP
jgi:hypothetical protein